MKEISATNPNAALFAAMMAAADSYSVSARESSFDRLCDEGDGLPETAQEFSCF